MSKKRLQKKTLSFRKEHPSFFATRACNTKTKTPDTASLLQLPNGNIQPQLAFGNVGAGVLCISPLLRKRVCSWTASTQLLSLNINFQFIRVHAVTIFRYCVFSVSLAGMVPNRAKGGQQCLVSLPAAAGIVYVYGSYECCHI